MNLFGGDFLKSTYVHSCLLQRQSSTRNMEGVLTLKEGVRVPCLVQGHKAETSQQGSDTSLISYDVQMSSDVKPSVGDVVKNARDQRDVEFFALGRVSRVADVISSTHGIMAYIAFITMDEYEPT